MWGSRPTTLQPEGSPHEAAAAQPTGTSPHIPFCSPALHCHTHKSSTNRNPLLSLTSTGASPSALHSAHSSQHLHLTSHFTSISSPRFPARTHQRRTSCAPLRSLQCSGTPSAIANYRTSTAHHPSHHPHLPHTPHAEAARHPPLAQSPRHHAAATQLPCPPNRAASAG